MKKILCSFFILSFFLHCNKSNTRYGDYEVNRGYVTVYDTTYYKTGEVLGVSRTFFYKNNDLYNDGYLLIENEVGNTYFILLMHAKESEKETSILSTTFFFNKKELTFFLNKLQTLLKSSDESLKYDYQHLIASKLNNQILLSGKEVYSGRHVYFILNKDDIKNMIEAYKSYTQEKNN